MSDPVSSKPRTSERLVARFLSRSPFLQFGCFFAAILLAKIGSLFEPPVWDAAMGVFPPAIYLYETGFDIRELLQQGNWWQGGPNVHSLSLYTWFVAAVMTLTGNATATFAVVHLATFAGVAYALVLFCRTLLRDGIAADAILAGASFLLLLPLVLVQVGYLYTEVWVMVFGIAAWSSWREGRMGSAVAMAAAALLVKMTGIAIAACVGLALVLRLWARPDSRRDWLLLPILPATLILVRMLPRWLGAASVPGPSWGDSDFLARALIERLGAIPDVTALLALGMACSLVYIGLRGGPKAGRVSLFSADAAVGARLIALLMPFAFCAGILGAVFSQILFLPRYLVPAIPFAIAPILMLAQAARRERLALVGFVLAALYSVVNFEGRLYAPEFGSFSVVERSHAYRKFHRVQMELIDAIERAPSRIPVFVSKEIDYMLSDPMMGYVTREMPQIRPLYLAENKGRPIDDYPIEFMIAYSNPSHGGEEAARIAQAAQVRPDIDLRVRRFEHEGFHTTLFWIHRHTDAAEAAPRATDDIPTPRSAHNELRPSLLQEHRSNDRSNDQGTPR